MAIENRIREWREKRNLTVEALAEAAGISPGYLSRMERGERNVSLKNLARLAGALNIHDRDLVGPQAVAIPVVGLVSAGGSISTESENHLDPLFEVELPLSLADDVVGFQVVGDSMFPRYDAGDVIIVSRAGEDVDLLLGFEAIVKVGDRDGPGDRFFKRIIRGQAPATYDLESYNAPVMRGVRIGWAASMIAKVPATQWRRRNGQAAKAAVRKAKRA